MSAEHEHYYVPESSRWPLIASLSIGAMLIGLVNIMHGTALWFLCPLGLAAVLYMAHGWFKDVIHESMEGLYSAQMDRSFRWGMIWFIFSEVMFFLAFFGALFYARHIALAWLGGDTVAKAATHQFLWPEFTAQWPLLNNPDPSKFAGPTEAMPAWGLPLINTCLLLTSGVTITIAHWGLMKARQSQLVLGLMATVALGILFLICQGYEYYHAYHAMGLTLDSGIYGSTFFLLTGFHGLHVTLGTIMLIVIMLRSMKRHFKPEHHFAFEAVAWYWHFVDVVWLFLFVFVYMI